MSRAFISHSSNDKTFAARLAANLQDAGYQPLLDEWEIKERDCIFSKIGQEAADADFVIIVISEHAACSGWVDNQWKTRFWDGIQRNKPLVLPVLIENCQIPQLLVTKRHFNFKGDYTSAFLDLISFISQSKMPPLFTYDLFLLGIKHFHKDRKSARLLEHLEAAEPGTQINILGIALTDFTFDPLRTAIKNKLEEGCKFRLMHLSLDSKYGEQKSREENWNYAEWKAYLKAHYDALQTIPGLVEPEFRKNIVLAEYDAPPNYFIFTTLKTVVVGFYVRDRSGTDSFHIELDVKENGVYIQFYNHFRSLWESTGRSWNGFS